jgi:branched-chain amino acid aminotransferase
MEQIDWKTLPFGYSKTDFNIRCYYRDGKWGNIEVSDSEHINMHMAATCLHYGQEAFEGMKAYRGQDGKVRLFRCEENAKRMQNTAEYIMMAQPPLELFKEMVIKAVKLNERFVPPYGTGATLYIRPLLIGVGPEIGVKPSKEYLLIIFVTPVGPYFKSGFKPVDVMICRDYDRAAPKGTGHIKVGGNYAASLVSIKQAQDRGFTTALYLDAAEKKYIDECGQVNFFGIKNNTYVTPQSRSVLPSITNMSIMHLATEMGLKVERRPIAVEELETFEEVGGCGTAAVITSISKIVDYELNKTYQYSASCEAGPISTKLYKKLTAIQFGDEVDKYGWVTIVE